MSKFEITQSIIHKCPALKMPQTFIEKIANMAQIVPLQGVSLETAQFIADACNFATEAQTQKPVEFDLPEYHYEGMGCGIEDRNITDRYEACRYGFDSAICQVDEMLENMGPLFNWNQPTDKFKLAYEEWSNKTDWVQERKDWPFIPLGMHRADVLKKYIEHLESQLANKFQPFSEPMKQKVFNAIRDAYDLGYKDSNSSGYRAKEVEVDHGDALIRALEITQLPGVENVSK